MSKQALCITKDQFSNPINQWCTQLVDRSICETDETTLQVIPYITLVDEKTGNVFTYLRGKGGKEDRLHSKISIGVGGHIETEVSTTLIDLIALDAAREIEEEVGVVVDHTQIAARLEKGMYTKLYTPESVNPVDRVHVGVAFTVRIDKDKVTKLEEDVILNTSWVDRKQLCMMVEDENTRLECWSILRGRELT